MNDEQRSLYEGLRQEARRVFATPQDEARDARLRELFAEMAKLMMQDREQLRRDLVGPAS